MYDLEGRAYIYERELALQLCDLLFQGLFFVGGNFIRCLIRAPKASEYLRRLTAHIDVHLGMVMLLATQYCTHEGNVEGTRLNVPAALVHPAQS